jgi:hypothetical protein
MGAFRELSEMSREYGLGRTYFLLVSTLLAALMVALYLWGRVDDQPPPAQIAPQVAPSTPSSY